MSCTGKHRRDFAPRNALHGSGKEPGFVLEDALRSSPCASRRFVRSLGSPAFLRFGLAAALASPLLMGASSLADVLRIDEIRVSYARSMGLPEFEDPRANLAALETALRAYRKGLSAGHLDDDAGILAPVQLTRLGTCAAVVAADPAPLQVSAQHLDASFDGVYWSVVKAFADRADAFLAANPGAASATSVKDFRDRLPREGSVIRLEQPGMQVGFENVEGVAVFHEEDPAGGMELRPLPLVATLDGIESSSIPTLLAQLEQRIEKLVALDEGRMPLDFLVGAEIARDPATGSAILDVKVNYLGPASSAGIPVSAFTLSFAGGDGAEIFGFADGGEYDLPAIQDVLAATRIRLYRVNDGGREMLTDFAIAAAPEDVVEFTLDQPLTEVLGETPRLSVGALQAIMAEVVATLKDETKVPGGGLLGVYVDAARGQIDMARGGVEAEGRKGTEFAIRVVPGIVGNVRVVASGSRTDPADRVDPYGARFERIKERSPFQPDVPSKQVLRSRELTDYLDRAGRQPGRRLDAAVTALPPAAADAAGAPTADPSSTVGLDYLLSESKPWTVYAQESNTGTESTGEWMTRVGYFNSDLFGNDEIFSLEFLTTNLEDSNAVNAYFDAPVGDSELTRWKVYAGWNEYTASDVGFPGANFEGSSPFAGVELSHNVLQDDKLFIDAVAGFRWTNQEVTNFLSNRKGDESFYIPQVGVRMQRNVREATTDCSVFLDVGLGADTSQLNLNSLGRLAADKDWQVLRWDLSQSFYLEPLFRAKGDTSPLAFANEIYLRAKGQYAFDNRLVPGFMAVAGGFYTVRGYQQSIVAGDNAYMFTGEYRLHLPQILGFEPDPQPLFGIGDPFRLRPQYAYGATDWDFIIRGFVDYAEVSDSEPFSYEGSDTLLGVGVGAELKFLSNFNLRVDLGFPLEDVPGVETDDYQIYFVGTISF